MIDVLKNEFLDLLELEVPQLKFKEIKPRSFEFIASLLIFGSLTGAFSGLWNVFSLWVKRHANAKIIVSYKAEDGSVISVEYNSLTKKEVEKYLASHPPNSENPVKLVLLESDNSSNDSKKILRSV